MRHFGTEIRTWLPKPQAATFIVAALDSLHKERADYVCDGVDDQVEIQAAIDALPVQGGLVQLTEGTYNLAATLAINDHSIWLNGYGPSISVLGGTRLLLCDNKDVDIINVSRNGCIVSNLLIDGNKGNNAAGSGVTVTDDATILKNLWVINTKDDGINITGDLCRVHDIKIQTPDGTGLFTTGNDGFGSNIHIVNSGNNGVNLAGAGWIITNLHTSLSHGEFGIRIHGSFNSLSNIYIDNSYHHGLHITSGSAQNYFAGQIYESRYGGVAPGYGAAIYGNYNTIIAHLKYLHEPQGIVLGSLSMGNVIIGCTFVGYSTPILDEGIGNKWNEKHSDLFMDVLAVSATQVVNAQACHVDPTTLTVGAGIAAQPDVPRTLSWVVNNAGGITAADISITGVDAKGNSITETFDLTGGLTGETNNAFATVSEVKIENQVNAAAGDTISVGITDVLGLSNIIYATGDVYKIKKNAADEVVAAAHVNTTYDTYDMAVIGLAATDDFTIWFKSNLNIIS